MGARKRNPGKGAPQGMFVREGSAPHVLRLGACSRRMGNCGRWDAAAVCGLVHRDARIPSWRLGVLANILVFGRDGGYHRL